MVAPVAVRRRIRLPLCPKRPRPPEQAWEVARRSLAEDTLKSQGIALEFGGGFNAPIGNDTSSNEGGPFITWGGNLTAGAGLHFSQNVSLLGEFQFIDNKLPGAFIAEAGAGATNGNTHIISITANPVIDLFPKSAEQRLPDRRRRLLSQVHQLQRPGLLRLLWLSREPSIQTRSAPINPAAASASASRIGWAAYGDGNLKVFGESRYLYINTPRVGEINGLGRTELIPVTVGVRW
jgi:hypothetical protein